MQIIKTKSNISNLTLNFSKGASLESLLEDFHWLDLKDVVPDYLGVSWFSIQFSWEVRYSTNIEATEKSWLILSRNSIHTFFLHPAQISFCPLEKWITCNIDIFR